MKIKEKRWDKNKEKEILEFWENNLKFKFDPENEKILVIDTPPPYTAEIWHLGCLSYIYQDFVARSYRMMGYSVLYPPGWDRNGIKIEGYVERSLGINMHEYDREEFLKICRENLDKFTEKMRYILKNLFIGFNWEYEYLTDSPEYRKITQKTFIDLWNKGLIYISDRANWYCPYCKTTIANAEVEYKEEEGYLNYISFEVVDSKDKIIIATTRPELLGACSLIIVNPQDERYKHLIGKKAKVPLYGHEVEIVGNDSADPEFGTGAVMICSYGDFNDVKIFEKYKLEPRIIIDTDGLMKDKILYGLSIREARNKIIELLKEHGFLVDQKKIKHNVPVHDRCKKPVEIIPMEEYYLKQVDFLKDIEKLAYELKFVPDRERNRLLDWIKTVSHDWPISRRRIYATEVPVWICKNCGYRYVPEPGKYYQPWKETLDKECPKCGANDWQGETKVFDTWFDSSITILYITKYFDDPEIFERSVKIRPQGYDIVRTWLYYTLLRVYQLTGKRAFDYALISGMALDEHGRKMSKSLGNVIEPEELINNYEIDAIRFWLALYAPFGENYKVSLEKIKASQKFITKLWNIARFISQFDYVDNCDDLKSTDKWILSELNRLEKEVIEYYKTFEFYKAVEKLYNFVWDIFASHYIEMVKKRLYENDASGRYTSYLVLKEVLKLLAPIVPGITEYLWLNVFDQKSSIHLEKYDFKFEEIYSSEITDKIIDFNSYVWNKKRENGLSLKDEISIGIPKDLEDFKEDLIKMHNIV